MLRSVLKLFLQVKGRKSRQETKLVRSTYKEHLLILVKSALQGFKENVITYIRNWRRRYVKYYAIVIYISIYVGVRV